MPSKPSKPESGAARTYFMQAARMLWKQKHPWAHLTTARNCFEVELLAEAMGLVWEMDGKSNAVELATKLEIVIQEQRAALARARGERG